MAPTLATQAITACLKGFQHVLLAVVQVFLAVTKCVRALTISYTLCTANSPIYTECLPTMFLGQTDLNVPYDPALCGQEKQLQCFVYWKLVMISCS